MAKLKYRTVSQAKKRCWEMFSKYIRTRDAIRTTGIPEEALCITCDRRYSIKELQAGHFLPGRHTSVLFDERGVHAQCYGCNVMKNGNSIKYFRKMQTLYGDKVIEELEELDTQVKQFKTFELDELYEVFKVKLAELTPEKILRGLQSVVES
ncbi:MAG: recombination protein NinG [Candidatus Berkelbacteria bacterium]|nr:recombination protein NinG [Candidatus Berkelbacteria bacterium]